MRESIFLCHAEKLVRSICRRSPFRRVVRREFLSELLPEHLEGRVRRAVYRLEVRGSLFHPLRVPAGKPYAEMPLNVPRDFDVEQTAVYRVHSLPNFFVCRFEPLCWLRVFLHAEFHEPIKHEKAFILLLSDRSRPF